MINGSEKDGSLTAYFGWLKRFQADDLINRMKQTLLTWYREFKARREDSWDMILLACWRSKPLSHGRAHTRIAPL